MKIICDNWGGEKLFDLWENQLVYGEVAGIVLVSFFKLKVALGFVDGMLPTKILGQTFGKWIDDNWSNQGTTLKICNPV